MRVRLVLFLPLAVIRSSDVAFDDAKHPVEFDRSRISLPPESGTGGWMEGIENVHFSRASLAAVAAPSNKAATAAGSEKTMADQDLAPLNAAVLFAAAAYCKEEGLRTWSCGFRCEGPASGTQLLAYFSFPTWDTTGYVAINESLKWIVVAFRGSESFANWLENMETWKSIIPWPNSPITPVYVHAGFLKGYLEAQSMILQQVSQALQTHPGYQVVCVGHSLGGALTTLAAADLRSTKSVQVPDLRLISFGAPRVGDKSWPGYLRGLLPGDDKVLRLVNRADIVPHVPPSLFGFTHAPRELWTNMSGIMVDCSTTNGEDPNCSDSLYFPNSVTDHLTYLNVLFGPYC